MLAMESIPAFKSVFQFALAGFSFDYWPNMYSITSRIFTSALALSSASQTHALNITVFQPGVQFAPKHLPRPFAASRADEIVNLFSNLGRTTVWRSVKNITFAGDSDEPEGLVRVGEDRYFVSTTEAIARPVSYGNSIIKDGTDRSPGAGFSHIIVYDGKGRPIAKSTYNKPGALEYHFGGIDYDGSKLWVTLAQYRPNTTAAILEIDPRTLQAKTVLRYRDHLGGIVHDPEANELFTLNWGARNASKWHLSHESDHHVKGNSHHGDDKDSYDESRQQYSSPAKVTRNPSYFVDYQDCKFLGRPAKYHRRAVAICSGVTSYSPTFSLGGLAIVDLETVQPLDEVPITLKSATGVTLTQNPTDFNVVDGKLRVYFLPDQHISTLYVYEAEIDSPYQY